MEKPKITHKMVRRMSFMKFSFRSWKRSKSETKRVAQDRARQHTKDGIVQNGATSNSYPVQHREALKLAANMQNT
jgi:hypothetical protein